MSETDAIKTAVDEAAKRAALAESYTTADGTSVKRPKLTDVLEARRSLADQQRAESGGMFRKVQAGRPS